MTRLWKHLCAWFWRATFRPESDVEIRARMLGLYRRVPGSNLDHLERLLRSELPAGIDLRLTRTQDKRLGRGVIEVEVRHG